MKIVEILSYLTFCVYVSPVVMKTYFHIKQVDKLMNFFIVKLVQQLWFAIFDSECTLDFPESFIHGIIYSD